MEGDEASYMPSASVLVAGDRPVVRLEAVGGSSASPVAPQLLPLLPWLLLQRLLPLLAWVLRPW